MAKLYEYFKQLTDEDGSDLHFASGLEPRLRTHGDLKPMQGRPALDGDQLDALMEEIATPEQWQVFRESGDLDFAIGVPGVARFRANYFRQERGSAAVFRIIPEKIPALEDLGAPEAVAKLADLQRGLVLVTGPTGSGKSTTLAAIIDRINRQQTKHIVTIEDPVEFVHTGRQSIISHREVGEHTQSFREGLKAAIRQDADVILVGELRDLETISLAITAAEMGSLVFGTLHTNSAPKTVDRLIDVFPSDEQAQVRLSLSESLAAVVAQLLLPTADGKGRVAVHEILLRAKGLGNIIREGNTPMISSVIQGGRSLGMQAMDDALLECVKNGKITAEDALRKATDRAKFEAQIR